MTVVVMTRNGGGRLLRTLSALTDLPEQPPVIVVDNDSEDGSPAAVAAHFPAVRVIRLPRNAGAGARNVGVRQARTPYVAFADDDSWWAPGALGRAAGHLDAHPRLGILVARTLVGPDERPDPLNSVLAASPLGIRDRLPGPSVLGFLACATVVRRDAFLEAGGFSDLLFFLGEETLLAWNVAAAGWQLAYCPDVVAHHQPVPADPATAAARRRLQQRNALLTSWLRRPTRTVARDTAKLAAAAVRDRTARGSLWDAVVRLPDVRRQRRLLPAAVEDDIRLLETAGKRVAAGRSTAGSTRGTGRGRIDTGPDYDPEAIRAWAESQGIEVSRPGRLPPDLVAKYQAANS